MPVHPHGCGERECYEPSDNGYDGSSPRVWGTLMDAFQILKFIRFIPTGVGNACALNPMLIQWAVHPHGCGERFVPLASLHQTRGSSPRVWGTLCCMPIT